MSSNQTRIIFVIAEVTKTHSDSNVIDSSVNGTSNEADEVSVTVTVTGEAASFVSMAPMQIGMNA